MRPMTWTISQPRTRESVLTMHGSDACLHRPRTASPVRPAMRAARRSTEGYDSESTCCADCVIVVNCRGVTPNSSRNLLEKKLGLEKPQARAVAAMEV